jgi:5-methylcytosine-specific restriction endonuclease McrA
VSDPFESDAMPTISASTWEQDVRIEVDDEMVDEIKKALAKGDDPAWSCIRCHCALRPWDGDDVYIARKHLEEDHSLPTETGTKRTPCEAMRSLVLELYEHECFGCGVTATAAKLTIDHIIPRSRGGDAAFRNLQPLCEVCQQKKADQEGEELYVSDNIYFRSPAADSYDGLFW